MTNWIDVTTLVRVEPIYKRSGIYKKSEPTDLTESVLTSESSNISLSDVVIEAPNDSIALNAINRLINKEAAADIKVKKVKKTLIAPRAVVLPVRPALAPAPLAPLAHIVNFSNSLEDREFWRIIGLITWCDKSDLVISIDRTKSHFTVSDLQYIKNNFMYFMNSLEKKFNDTGFYDTVNQLNDKDAFKSHIIAKGKDFFSMILECPMVAEYLLTEYQNFLPVIA